MNFGEFLKMCGGIVKGRILRVSSYRTQAGDKVKINVGLPELCFNFDMTVNEKWVPDCLEGREIQLLPVLKVGNFNKPEIHFDIKEIAKG